MKYEPGSLFDRIRGWFRSMFRQKGITCMFLGHEWSDWEWIYGMPIDAHGKHYHRWCPRCGKEELK